MVYNPGIRRNGKYLLQVFLSIYGDWICLLPVRRDRNLWLIHVIPSHTLGINPGRGIQKLFPDCPLRACESRSHSYAADIPFWDQVAPERDFAGIKRLIFIVQP